MRNQLVLACICVAVWVPTQSAFAQVVARLDDESFFVLHGSGVSMGGVQIQSESGGLIPVPDNNAAPFQFLLMNTNNEIVFGNLGNSFALEGSVKLGARWNSNWHTQDVEMEWGDGPTPRPVTLTENFYELGGPCEQCPAPPMNVSLNDDHFVVLTGGGNKLTEITFRSPSNSLLLPSSPAPFAELTSNTPSEVTFATPGSHVVIDGAVTLGLGWNDHVYRRDISYDFQPLSGARSKTTNLANKNYNLPEFPSLDVWINDEDQFVISGAGQPITELSLFSNTGSLIPGQNPAPFGRFQENTANRVTMNPAGEVLVLDGQVTLDTKWDWKDRSKRITASYDLLGDLPDTQFSLSSSNFPDVPVAGREPLLITLDDQNNFVITGIGQEVNGIEFESSSGGLTTSEEATAPFPHLLFNTPDKITLGVLGSVVVDGSHVMDFGLSDPALLDEITITVGYGFNPFPNPANEICSRCDLPQVSMSADRGLVLTDFPDPITELRFFSPHGGLTSFDPPEGVTIAASTPTELLITSQNGFDAEIMEGLAVAWGAPQDFGVFVSFSLADGRRFGPFVIGASAELVPEPVSLPLLLAAFVPLMLLRRRRRVW